MKAILFDLSGTLLDRKSFITVYLNSQYERFYTRLSPISKEQYCVKFIELDHRGYVWKDVV